MWLPNLSKVWTTLEIAIIMIALSGDLGATSYQILHNFGSDQDGSVPAASVTFASKGHLFGTTANGGSFGDGTVFELINSPNVGWTESVLHNFNYQVDGENPDGALILDASGNLYGTAPFRGPQLVGTVFELSPNGSGWDFSLLYDVGTHGGLVLDKSDNIYAPIGIGDFLGGAVGRLSPAQNDWTYTALYSFCAHRPKCVDGIQPQGPLAWDAAGNLYGNTLNGGIYKYPHPCPDQQGCGLVFQMRPHPDGTWSYHILYWFGAFVNDGLLLNGGLVVDEKGNVYGSTAVGGLTGTGTVFQLSPKPQGRKGPSVLYSETQLYTFPNCSQGCGPFGPLVRDRAGNLYGAAGGGNTSCGGYCGVVYKLSPQHDGTWRYTPLHIFNGSDGTGPNGVTIGADGNLYGTTIAGGQFNKGVAFEITP